MSKKEKGAIVVEATIALTSFIFMIYILLTIILMSLAQAKINIAVNCAAKEISQYFYLYSLTGLDKMAGLAEEKGNLADGGVDKVANGIETLYDEIGNIEKGNASLDSVKNSGKSAYEDIKSGVNTVTDDPKQFILSAAYATGEDLYEFFKSSGGQMLVKSMVKKNLRASTETSDLNTSVERFLKYCRVVPSGTSYMAGLDFSKTEITPQGTDNDLIIKIVCDYDVSVIRLLGIDYTFHMTACGKTQAWAVGEMTAEKSFKPVENNSEESSTKPETTTEPEESTTQQETTTKAETTTRKKETAKDYAKKYTHNPNSNRVFIGKDARIEGESNAGTYLLVQNTPEMQEDLGANGTWMIQKEFMQTQINKRNTFYLTEDPEKATGDFAKQVQYLKDHDYVIEEGPLYWVATPASKQ